MIAIEPSLRKKIRYDDSFKNFLRVARSDDLDCLISMIDNRID